MFIPVEVWRGLVGRCPSCGKGRLYRAYLKQVETCDACGANIGCINAEDGPPWLTVLILGPFLVSSTFIAVMKLQISPLVLVLSATVMTVALILIILPRVKGGWIGALWRMNQSKN